MKYLNYKSKAKSHDEDEEEAEENILKIYTLYYITHKSLKGERKTYTQTQM